MKRLLLLYLFLTFFSKCFSQLDTSKTEIIIIGTIHSGNKHFNHKTLYKLLVSLNPDIVLDEDSEKFKPVFGLKTATFLKIVKPGIEQLALQTLHKRNRNIIILPFDTTFSKKHYFKKKEKILTIFDSLQKATKENLDSINFEKYLIKRNYFYGLIQDKTLEEINEPKNYYIAKELHKDDKELILPLTKKYLKDTSLISSFENDLNFWEARNNFMVRQIQIYLNLYQGKKIIVLTGLSHKYFLIDKLKSNMSNNIKLMELRN